MYVSLVFGWMRLLGPGLNIALVLELGSHTNTVSCVSSVMDLGGNDSLDVDGVALLGMDPAGL